jgi:hypothetical protein
MPERQLDMFGGEAAPDIEAIHSTFKKSLRHNLEIDFGIVSDKMLDFVCRSFFSNRKHRLHDGYTSHYCRVLDIYFGKRQFSFINKEIGLYDVIAADYTKQLTRGIKPTAKLMECFNRAVDQWLPDIDITEHESISESGGVLSRNVTGSNSKFKSNILQAVQINVEALSQLIKITPTNNRETLVKAQAAVMLELAVDTKNGFPKGWISQRYTEHKTGRLYSDGVSLQNCCKEVRYSALNELHSYDFDNCHYSILAQLTTKKTPTIDYYLQHKKEVRTRLSNDLNLPVADVKQILISLIYGATLGAYDDTHAISKVCKTKECYLMVKANVIISGIYSEIAAAAKEIVKNHTQKKGRFAGKVVNKMGLVCEDRTLNKKLSHILQGYEVAALEVVTSITKSDTAALLHDGWVTYSLYNKALFEDAVFNQLGIKLSVDYEPIECKYFSSSKSATPYTMIDLSTLLINCQRPVIESLVCSSFINLNNLPLPSSFNLNNILISPLLSLSNLQT